jgi:hypothetical protein
MTGGVTLELALGVAALVVVPTNRPDGWIPVPGKGVYLAHAVVGGLLGIGAPLILLRTRRAESIVRLGATVGFVGLVLGAGGGLLTVWHPWRLAGIALMLAGTFVALSGYLIGLAGHVRAHEALTRNTAEAIPDRPVAPD